MSTSEDQSEYVTFQADSIEALVDQVSRFVMDDRAGMVMTESEKNVGQAIDFKG